MLELKVVKMTALELIELIFYVGGIPILVYCLWKIIQRRRISQSRTSFYLYCYFLSNLVECGFEVVRLTFGQNYTILQELGLAISFSVLLISLYALLSFSLDIFLSENKQGKHWPKTAKLGYTIAGLAVILVMIVQLSEDQFPFEAFMVGYLLVMITYLILMVFSYNLYRRLKDKEQSIQVRSILFIAIFSLEFILILSISMVCYIIPSLFGIATVTTAIGLFISYILAYLGFIQPIRAKREDSE